MKRLLALAILAFAVTGYAQEDPTLKETLKDPEIQKELSSPDGVTIARAEDGSWKIFARGSAAYDFNDPDEIRDAKEAALLRAKGKLANFLKEEVTASNAVDKLSKKIKNLDKKGNVSTTNVSKEDVTVMTESIRAYSDAILTGVISLSIENVPYDNESGEIQITVGQSSKTLQAAKEIRQGIKESLDDTPRAPVAVPTPAPAPAPAPKKRENKYYFRHSDTEF